MVLNKECAMKVKRGWPKKHQRWQFVFVFFFNLRLHHERQLGKIHLLTLRS